MKFSKTNFVIGFFIGLFVSFILYMRFIGIASTIDNKTQAVAFIGIGTTLIAIFSGYASREIWTSKFFDGDIALFLLTPLIAFFIFWLMIYLIETL